METYTTTKYPSLSYDISSHQHFDGLFLKHDIFDSFKEFFVETPLSDKEIWALLELMKSAYITRAYSDMLHTGGAHLTSNPVKGVIANDGEYNRINQEVIPVIMNEVYTLLTP